MEATLQQFDALRSPGRVDRLAPRMMAEMRVLKMRQCCKVTVNNSLIQPRGLSARHCRPSPAPRRRRKFIRDLRGALAECRRLVITLVGERVSVGQLTKAPGNSKNSTTFWGRLQKTLFPGNLDRMEGTCLESAADLLIPRPS